MKISRTISCILMRKVATVLLVSASMAAFATLGEGGKKDLPRSGKNLLSAKAPLSPTKGFSLRSGYNYRGSQVINATPQKEYIVLNKVVTIQKGNQTYILPLKRKVLLDRITFDPTKR